MKGISIQRPGCIEVVELPMPEIHEGEALLKVLYGGICGADVASYTGNQPFTTYPRIPGHEFSAQIVSVPANDRGLKPGDIVCFDTSEDGGDDINHTGIYLGSGKFIHGSSAAGKVIISTMSSGYYRNAFCWGRRVL